MQKILSAVQTRAADHFTIKQQQIDPIDLMEKASVAFVQEFLNHVATTHTIAVLCGMGNNGGDGFAIARLLLERGFHVTCYLVETGTNFSEDCRVNLRRLEKLIPVTRVTSLADLSLEKGVVIDAIFGSGLNRSISGVVAEVIARVNASKLSVVAVDIPSGLFADQVIDSKAIMKSALTITFQRPKLTFLIPETGRFVGEWRAVGIGLSQDFLDGQKSQYNLIDAEYVSSVLPKREKFGHKGNYGRVQLVAGSLGKMGAATLCGEASLKSGAGLLTIHAPRVGLSVVQTVLREAMVTVDDCETHVSKIPLMENANVVCVGPGLGTHKQTARALEELLTAVKVPMVIDADALNIIAQKPELLKNIPEGSVLTPHIGEFERMFGKKAHGLLRIEKIIEIAVTNRLVVVLKGAHTAVIDTLGQVFFNTTGNAGMATAGSGDVLAGIIAGLMAQGMNGKEAALSGVFVHGMAGDIAENKAGKTSLMASSLLNDLPKAFNNVTIGSLF